MKEDSSTILRILSTKLRSIAYLIENHHDQVGDPLDIEEINWGLGMILTDLSQELKTVSIQIGKDEVLRSQRKKS